MAYYKQYQGEFLSRDSAAYRVELWTESDTAPTEVSELTFPAESPLTIEWLSATKEEPICSSTATLTIISPGDRTYTGLYYIKSPATRMDVYRNGALYWSGILDPELYEEPYERAADYDVQLTFADFGVLDRTKFAETDGLVTVAEIITGALDAAGLHHGGIDTSMISTAIDGAPLDLAKLNVQSANFYDEDGEASTLKEVISACLQPFGLKIQQRAGRIWIYDLNGLYNAGATSEIYWTSDSQTMAADKVANDVRVTFSPYSSKSIMDIEAKYAGHTTTQGVGDELQYIDDEGVSNDQAIMIRNSYGLEEGEIYPSFNLFIGRGTGAANVSNGSYFKVLPLLGDANECEGILYGARVKPYGDGRPDIHIGNSLITTDTIAGTPRYRHYHTEAFFRDPPTGAGGKIYTTKRIYVAPSSARALLRITLEALIGIRNNPWSKDDGNYNREEEIAITKTGWMFLPIEINLYRGKNDATPYAHYTNAYVTSHDLPMAFRTNSEAEASRFGSTWVAGAAAYGDAWLAYYDGSDLREKSPLGSWMTNRHNVGRMDSELARAYRDKDRHYYAYEPYRDKGCFEFSFNQLDDGQYIPYPTEGGWLEISLWPGIAAFDYDVKLSSFGNPQAHAGTAGAELFDATRQPRRKFYDLLRWVMYKLPKVEICNNDIIRSEVDEFDVERTGVINPDASEHLDISTTVGTTDRPAPGARGITFYEAGGGLVEVKECTRAGHTDYPENLLIGTMMSQYAERHTKLTGEAAPLLGRVATVTERCQGDRQFLPISETQNIIEGTADLTVVELARERYTVITQIPDNQ